MRIRSLYKNQDGHNLQHSLNNFYNQYLLVEGIQTCQNLREIICTWKRDTFMTFQHSLVIIVLRKLHTFFKKRRDWLDSCLYAGYTHKLAGTMTRSSYILGKKGFRYIKITALLLYIFNGFNILLWHIFVNHVIMLHLFKTYLSIFLVQ